MVALGAEWKAHCPTLTLSLTDLWASHSLGTVDEVLGLVLLQLKDGSDKTYPGLHVWLLRIAIKVMKKRLLAPPKSTGG